MILAIANHKGGVGKTTVCVNLSVVLAALGKKVLLVDFDHQANATFSLGISPQDLPLSVYHVLMKKASLQSVLKKTSFFNYDILPSSPDLAGASIELINLKNREFKLSQLLKKVEGSYDFIIIDSPPSLGILTVNALVAADEVLIPVQCEYLALEGLNQLLSIVDLVRNNLKRELEVTGAVLTMYSRWNRLSRRVVKEVRRNFPGYVFDSIIPRSVAVAEAPRFGQTVLQYAPKSKASKAYKELAEEMISKKSDI